MICSGWSEEVDFCAVGGRSRCLTMGFRLFQNNPHGWKHVNRLELEWNWKNIPKSNFDPPYREKMNNETNLRKLCYRNMILKRMGQRSKTWFFWDLIPKNFEFWNLKKETHGKGKIRITRNESFRKIRAKYSGSFGALGLDILKTIK